MLLTVFCNPSAIVAAAADEVEMEGGEAVTDDVIGECLLGEGLASGPSCDFAAMIFSKSGFLGDALVIDPCVTSSSLNCHA